MVSAAFQLHPTVTEYIAKSRENTRKMKMLLHQTISVKNLSQQLVEEYVDPSSSSQDSGSSCITSTYLLHGEGTEERRWPHQKQEGVKAGNKW